MDRENVSDSVFVRIRWCINAWGYTWKWKKLGDESNFIKDYVICHYIHLQRIF